ncbi:MAG: LVIVD repeat-containing protein [Candidatus Hermodarchaeota archaeon]
MQKLNMKWKLLSVVLLMGLMSIIFLFFTRTPTVIAASGSFEDDFYNTDYLDLINTNVTIDYDAWGDGTLRLPDKEPTLAGTYDTSGYAKAVFIEGQMALIADGSAGLLVLNITDPVNPTLLDSYDTSGLALDVYVVDRYAYVADGASGLQVIDIIDPTNLVLVGSYNSPGNASGVCIQGNYAYLADRDQGLRVVSISNPTSPSSAGVYNTPGMAYAVAVDGNYAYVADGDQGLRAVDISTPSSPSSAGVYNTPGIAYDVSVAGDYAFVADGGSGVRIVDVTDPTALISYWSESTLDVAKNIFVLGDFAYVADNSSGLNIINIENPTDHTSVRSFDTTGYAEGIFTAMGYAFVADGYSGLQVVQVDDRSTSVVVGSGSDGGNDLDISGDYVFAAADQSGIRVIDIGNPTNPTEVGYYDPAVDWYEDVCVSGNYAFVAALDTGLEVFDISTPHNPYLVGHRVTTWAYAVDIDGDYAYIADDDNDLQVVDISDPTSPTLSGQVSLPGNAREITVVGDYAYVSSWDSGVNIVDISNPASPSAVGQYDTNESARYVFVSGGYAYVADYDGGLLILDVTTPASPTLIGHLPSANISDTSIYSVWVDGNYAYLGGGAFHTVNVTDPSNPTEIDRCGIWYGYGLHACGEYVYVADGLGLQAVEVMRNRGATVEEFAVVQSTAFFTSSNTEPLITAEIDDVEDSVPAGTSLTYYLSPDNGVNWEQVTEDVEHTFTNWGYQLKWKAELTTTNNFLTPSIEGIYWLTYTTDAEDPTWDTTPWDPTCEFGDLFSYSVSASDVSEIEYWINDTTHFTIDSLTGQITNNTFLAVGAYGLEIRAYDPYNRYISAEITVTVEDTTSPTWVIAPHYQYTITYGETFDLQLEAKDISGISHWSVSDTVNFAISDTGRLTSVGTLEPGKYTVRVYVYDIYDNELFKEIEVTVEPLQISRTGFSVESIIIGFLIIVIPLLIYRRRKRQ